MTGQRLKFYYGGSGSYGAQKALRKLEEPRIILNYASKANEPWPEIDELFIDSGGYSFMLGKGEYTTTARDYVDYLTTHEPEYWVLRDYPCESDVLNEHDRTVQDHQTMTVDAHRRVWDVADDRGVSGQRTSVVQGQTAHDYLMHIDQLRDHGVLADYVGIGSVCGREDIYEVRRIVRAVAEAIPNRDLHGFGLKRTALLEFEDVVDTLTSADSMAFSYAARYAAFNENRSRTWREVAYQYLDYKRRIAAVNARGDSADERRPDEQTALTEGWG